MILVLITYLILPYIFALFVQRCLYWNIQFHKLLLRPLHNYSLNWPSYLFGVDWLKNNEGTRDRAKLSAWLFWIKVPKIGVFRPYIFVFDPKMLSIRHWGLSKLIAVFWLVGLSAIGKNAESRFYMLNEPLAANSNTLGRFVVTDVISVAQILLHPALVISL